MNTVFLLLAQFNGRALIPVDEVCAAFFSHLSVHQFNRGINEGAIALPVVRITNSQKTARSVHVQDLAEYLDKRREAARKECRQLQM